MELTQDGSDGQGRVRPCAAPPRSRARRPAAGSISASRASGTARAGSTFRPTENPRAAQSNTDGFPGWFGWSGRPAPSFVRHAPLVAGKIVDGSHRNLLTYSVRAPEGLQSRRLAQVAHRLDPARLEHERPSYVATIAAAWPEIARDFIILGINGETRPRIGDDPRFNYTYVNYVGRSTFKGFPGTDRESPALVSQAMDELKEVYPIDHYLVGGHSQGGFLTYSLLMNFPESIAGAFPISAGVIIQCEPDVYADEAAAQSPAQAFRWRSSTARTIRSWASAWASTPPRSFGEAGWPAFRFFTDDTAAHMFARLPVGPAIRWLEALSSNDPKTLDRLRRPSVRQEGYRDADRRARPREHAQAGRRQKSALDELTQDHRRQGRLWRPQVPALDPKAKDGSWIDGFLAYRDDFEFAQPRRK